MSHTLHPSHDTKMGSTLWGTSYMKESRTPRTNESRTLHTNEPHTASIPRHADWVQFVRHFIYEQVTNSIYKWVTNSTHTLHPSYDTQIGSMLWGTSYMNESRTPPTNESRTLHTNASNTAPIQQHTDWVQFLRHFIYERVTNSIYKWVTNFKIQISHTLHLSHNTQIGSSVCEALHIWTSHELHIQMSHEL